MNGVTYVTKTKLAAFESYMRANEKAEGTIQNYMRHVKMFGDYLDGKSLSKESAMAWKSELIKRDYSPSSINAMLNAIHCFMHFCRRNDCRVKLMCIQKKIFRDSSQELSCDDYIKLVETAKLTGKEQISLIMETICSSGIRVSELKFITVEAVKNGETTIFLKGKIRTILLPEKLCKKLLIYAKKKKIASGEIFVTDKGKSVNRKQIWSQMKKIGAMAGIEESKIYPHNLRHLFARIYYKKSGDIAMLSDVLGHSSINTTRIYLISASGEHRKTLEILGLVT